MEHYQVLLANVIFTCGSAAQRSTFALLLMSPSELPNSPQFAPKHLGSEQKPTTARRAAGYQL